MNNENIINVEQYLWPMKLAMEQAEQAYKEDEVPVGAVVLDKFGNIVSSAYNKKEKSFNPCGHAEIFALIKAGEELKNWRLLGCTLLVTLEPCMMCMNALIQARIDKLVFGAYDLKGGAISLGYNFHQSSRFNHKFSITGGVFQFENSRLLSKFFREKRNYYKKSL